MLLFLFLVQLSVLLVRADLDPELSGTWVSKSRDVVTGPVSYARKALVCEIEGVL